MTDIPDTTLDLLNRTETALQAKLNSLLEGAGENEEPPDKWARAISTLLKALEETAARRATAEAKIAAQTHTRYEDMPPPTPEDEARFYERFRKLVDAIDDEGKVRENLGGTSRVGPISIP